MKTYTLKELLALREEYLGTLRSDEDSWYGSEQVVYGEATLGFLSWINIKENTP